MIFIDAGFWQGRALEIYKDIGLVNNDWKIYAFEPNPEIDIDFYVKKLGLNLSFSPCAVWTKDGKAKFSISEHETRQNASALKGTAGPPSPKFIDVETIDFPKFVASLPDEFTVCNMDIEGAEFPVLRQMIKDGTIDKINMLEVEFHHRLMEKEEKANAEKIVEDLVRHNVKVIIKVPL